MDSLTLVTQLRELQLWPEEEPAQSRALALSQRLPDARSLARELIGLNLLTPYQANQILTGKGRSLVAGPYRILERLGEGGMSQVYKARHCRLHRIVALKIIRREKITNTTLGRFHREIDAAARLSHPNLVRAYDADEFDDTWFLAMQYVHGTDLSRLVKREGPLPIVRACDYAYQAAAGLLYLHQNGLVHRDIKPSNLMITAAPSTQPGPNTGSGSLVGVADMVKILDLGLARLCEPPPPGVAPRLALTHMGSYLGTADYMSPEQARDSREADGRSDIYSLGCTLYFALAGQAPFPGSNAIEKMLHHQLDEPTPLEQLRPDVPPALAAVVRRMMAKVPAQRYQTVAEVLEALGPFCGVPAPVVAPLAPVEVVPAAAAVDSGAAEPMVGPLVLLRPEALPHRGQPPFNGWVWVATASTIACGVLLLILIVRLVTR
jgi:serine/threonine protein kinase